MNKSNIIKVPKKTLLVVLGRGGHTEQLLRLVNKLGDKFNYEYVIGKEDNTSEKKIKFKGSVFKILNPRLMTDHSKAIVALKLIPSTIQACNILRKSNANAIITAGPSLAIPFFTVAKLFRIKTIFIESWVRVKHKSISGKLLYPLSDVFFVQWPDMKLQYPKAIYAGRLS